MSSATATTTLHALCRANLGILQQKLSLLHAIQTKFGMTKAKAVYAQVCPIVQASVGQHIRHSMDHVELATQVAAAQVSNTTTTTIDQDKNKNRELHYDLRQRGQSDEYDIEAAQRRVEHVMEQLNKLIESSSSSTTTTTNANHNDNDDTNRHVQAYFMLSSDPQEFVLPSTVEREMGFAAHHAIHHLAMVKIIVQNTIGITDLPADFGKAPSTIVHDNKGTDTKDNPQNP